MKGPREEEEHDIFNCSCLDCRDALRTHLADVRYHERVDRELEERAERSASGESTRTPGDGSRLNW